MLRKKPLLVLLLCVVGATVAQDPVTGYTAHKDETISGAALGQSTTEANAAACGARCTANTQCIAFAYNTKSQSCQLNTWSTKYSVGPSPGENYYFRDIPRNDAPARPAVAYQAAVPTGNVTLDVEGSLLGQRFLINLQYLRQFPSDDLLYWFRKRSGQQNPPGQSWGWDNGGPDAPYGLRGSIAGLFMMGAGGALRWHNDSQLWQTLTTVVDGIEQCQQADGYAMAFPQNESNYHENPDYVTSWVTHGLIEASFATRQEKPLQILRRHFDWFNYAGDVLAQFLPPDGGLDATDGLWPPKSQQTENGHKIYLINQGIIHNTRLAQTPVGTQRDVDLVSDLYQEAWWVEQLAQRNLSAIWQRHYYPHNYEVTAFEAYLDMYVLTGDSKYLSAVEGAWDMMRDHWMHAGGSFAINEMKLYPPDSYFLDADGRNPWAGHPTGELCGSSFWIKLNQRLHRLRPTAEVYASEIERSVINIVIANQSPDGKGIRYFAHLHNFKDKVTNIGTCCEGQGTRQLGALPEYLYSVTDRGVLVNLYQTSAYSLTLMGSQVLVACIAGFPYNGSVRIVVTANPPATFSVYVRIPSWLAADSANVTINGDAQDALVGQKGTYLEIRRQWSANGDRLEFMLPMTLRLSPYTGYSQFPGYTRYAYEYGPTLLAVTGPWANVGNGTTAIIIPADPTTPEKWLKPVPGQPLHWTANATGGTALFQPYFEVQDQQFSAYPAFPQPLATCGVATEDWPAENTFVRVGCPSGKKISGITFAAFGVFTGSCGTGFQVAGCSSVNASAIVRQRCLGNDACTVPAEISVFGDPCQGTVKRLGISVAC